jgi:D-alanyl-lipoteichoic acid acyltransferase DltB (MBOAT superfamily)
MLMGLHGTSIIKIFTILLANFAIAKIGRGGRWAPLATWVFNGAVLFANEWYSGYTFAVLHPSFKVLVRIGNDGIAAFWLNDIQDSLQGVYPRWQVSFNITMLRLVSFNMDYFWTCNRVGQNEVSSSYTSTYHLTCRDCKAGSILTEKQRTSTSHSLDTFSFKNYIAYILYPPLYIAGPIITFNDFMWQVSLVTHTTSSLPIHSYLQQHRRPTAVSLRTVLIFAFRFLTSLLIMELILHFMYVVAIKDTRAWHGDSPFQLSMIGFWNLMIVWLKVNSVEVLFVFKP